MKKALLVFTVFVITACSTRNVISDEREYVARHIIHHPSIEHYQLAVGEHQLHYATHGDDKKPALIIIHGTPGNWQQYARYLLNDTLLAHYYMVVIDRPGWGRSTLGQDKRIASFAEQANIVGTLAKKLRLESGGQPVVLMGHSLGASLAPRVAMDFPDDINGLLLFAGTLDPKLSSPRWFNYLGAAPFAKYIIGDRFSRSNKEIFALQEDVGAMNNRWHEIEAEVIAVQGMKDGLVYPANSDFIEKTFNPKTTSVVRLKNEGHLFPMTQREAVVDWAITILDIIQSAPKKIQR
jgi:pimeloyl-ACP methyl ester carboxylesterase